MNTLRGRLLDLFTALVTLSALGAVGWRVLSWGRDPNGPIAPREVEEWQEYGGSGRRIGPDSAKVTIVAFLDYQCPFCAQANRDLESLAAAYPAEVALVFRHLPLVKIHPSAKEAALAAECAAMQGRFRAFHTLLYSSQDSIGVESWVSLAESAQVADLRRFDGCVTTGEARASLTRDSLAAKDLDVPGTPTLLINNLLILGYPGERALQEMVHDKLKEFRQ